MSLKIKTKLLSNKAVFPKKAYSTDAGFDLTATSKRITQEFIEYGTDIAFQIPEGYVGLIYPRSSVTKKDLMLKNSVGVIDSNYLGEIMFRFNLLPYTRIEESDGETCIDVGVKYDFKHYEIGDRIGQIIFQKLPEIELVETDEFAETERGEKRFGSTGN